MTRFVFFTFKAHVAEVELFEDFFTLIKPLILKHPQYAYCIEKDNTVDRHLHMLVGDPKYTEIKQFKQKLNAKRFQDFKLYIKQGYQTNQHAFDTQLVPDKEEDIMKLLGYIYKEDVCIRRDSTFSSEYIQDSYKLYFTSEKIKYKMRKNDWRYINNKNAHAMIEDFINKSDIYHFGQLESKKFHEIKWHMVDQGISFAQIGRDTLNLVLEELTLRHVQTEYTPGDKYNGGEDKLWCDKCGGISDNLSQEDAAKLHGSAYGAMCDCQKEKYWSNN